MKKGRLALLLCLSFALPVTACGRIDALWDSFFGDDSSAMASDSVEKASSSGTAAAFFKPETEVDIVPFPPVPLRWTQSISGTSVIYTSPQDKPSDSREQNENTATLSSEVRITYTKRTQGMDAYGYINAFVSKHQCRAPLRVGVGFYTAACPDSGSNVVVIGEVGNLYLIEISGIYDRSVKALVEGYVRAIISGKRVFHDRNVGMVER